MIRTDRKATEDPLFFVSRVVNRLHSQWLRWTYPFHSIGSDFWAHNSCDLRRSVAPYIQIGDRVKMDRDAWLDVPLIPRSEEPVILLEDGCQIGRRCLISAQNRVQIGKNSIFGPAALIMDHPDESDYVDSPVIDRETKKGGTIRIEEGCWIGFRAAIVCSEGELVVGKNSVIGANAVVVQSVPPYSVVAGNPAKVVKQYEPSEGVWLLGAGTHRRKG
jgi:acetyltransferase-like isoleucine patch superfamily enzyme